MPRTQASFGARLRALRLDREMSQVELARRIGRHQTAIGPYERGEYAPPPTIVERLAASLETSPEFLLFGREPGRSSLPLLGRIAAGGMLVDAGEGARPLRLADSRLVAVLVEDEAMAPLLRPGQIALVAAASGAPAALLGREALAELGDGRTLLRRLFPGATAGRFDLAAQAAPTLRDMPVVAARALLGVLWPAALEGEAGGERL
jgi:transcriptional regulator with XRE-family HTH domain